MLDLDTTGRGRAGNVPGVFGEPVGCVQVVGVVRGVVVEARSLWLELPHRKWREGGVGVARLCGSLMKLHRKRARGARIGQPRHAVQYVAVWVLCAF
jgi:hypothetical protein